MLHITICLSAIEETFVKAHYTLRFSNLVGVKYKFSFFKPTNDVKLIC